MKHMKMLIWLTQLGLSVVAPLGCFVLLAVWLRQKFGLGNWVIIAGVILGIICAVDGLRVSLKAMENMSENKKEEKPPLSFNDHN
jgi:MFS-type transporter involved in bile tolerance (Atg22 family)